jgi:uncharacterized protein YeaO (DUF488 family)
MNKVSELATFQIGSPRSPDEGLRIGAVRYLPRGVRKENYASADYFDVWLPILSPSAELIRWFRTQEEGPRRLKRFFEKYEHEMIKGTDSRQVIQLVRELARRTPLAVGCYCVDESQCHRSVLKRLIESRMGTE